MTANTIWTTQTNAGRDSNSISMPRSLSQQQSGSLQASLLDQSPLPPLELRAPRSTADRDAARLRSTSMKRRLSFVYCGSLFCVGLCMGAQGPATLALAEQAGVVSNALTGEDTPSHPRDVSRLGEMGFANGSDAIAGIFGAL